MKIELAPPPLGSVLAYRGVYALCTTNKDGMLHATHYCTCLIGGPEPVWGVWTIHGRFVRFYGRKSKIADAYPRLVWRRKQATWGLQDVHDKSVEERRHELEAMYKPGKVLGIAIRHGNVIQLNGKK